MRTRLLAVLAVAAAACGQTPGNTHVTTTDLSSMSDMMPAGADDMPGTQPPADMTGGVVDDMTAVTSSTSATVRVHYPAGAHQLTIRGSAATLDWTVGKPMTSGAGDTWTYKFTNLSSAAEWKPLLDDTTWARGPNYHVAPGDALDVYPHFTTVKGKVVTLIASFSSTVLKNTRVIYAWLPASYDENTVATYPVVYMHDAQNLWDSLPQLAFSTPWGVDTTFDKADETGTCSANGLTGWAAQPLGGTATTCNGDGDCAAKDCRTFPEAIIIGVSNTSARGYEYTPTSDPSYDSQIGPSGGGDLYVQMLVQELKPQIDKMLRTRTDVASTSIVGSSLGGLISAYAGLKRPDVFGLVGEISPSSWWNNDVIVADIKQTKATPMRPLRIYVDSGSGTADDQADTDMLAAGYMALGYQEGTNFHHVVQPGAQHAEMYWAQRFPGAMQVLLGAR